MNIGIVVFKISKKYLNWLNVIIEFLLLAKIALTGWNILLFSGMFW